MARAVEMLHSLRMLFAQLLVEGVFIFVFEIKVFLGQDLVLLYYFKQNVDVQGQSLCTLQILYQLTADGASDTVLMVQLLNTASAESVPAVNQNPRNSLTDIVLLSAVLTDVQLAGLVI